MLYKELKKHLEKNGETSLADLSHQFHIPSKELQTLLSIWVESGYLIKKEATSYCNEKKCSCNTCILSFLETYSVKK